MIRQGLASLLVMLALHVFSASAQQVPSSQGADWLEVRKTITDMRARAGQVRTNGLHAYNKAVERCNRKLLGNSDCMTKAKRQRDESEREAARIEKSAESIEKVIRNEGRETRKAAQAERDRMRESMGRKRDIEQQNKREKLQLKIEKLKPADETKSVTGG